MDAWRALSEPASCSSIASSSTLSIAIFRKPAWRSAVRIVLSAISTPRMRAILFHPVIMEDPKTRHRPRERGRRGPAIVKVHHSSELGFGAVHAAGDLDGEDLSGGDEAPRHLAANILRDL